MWSGKATVDNVSCTIKKTWCIVDKPAFYALFLVDLIMHLWSFETGYDCSITCFHRENANFKLETAFSFGKRKREQVYETTKGGTPITPRSGDPRSKELFDKVRVTLYFFFVFYPLCCIITLWELLSLIYLIYHTKKYLFYLLFSLPINYLSLNFQFYPSHNLKQTIN